MGSNQYHCEYCAAKRDATRWAAPRGARATRPAPKRARWANARRGGGRPAPRVAAGFASPRGAGVPVRGGSARAATCGRRPRLLSSNTLGPKPHSCPPLPAPFFNPRSQLHLSSLPPYLCVSLQRFVFDAKVTIRRPRQLDGRARLGCARARAPAPRVPRGGQPPRRRSPPRADTCRVQGGASLAPSLIGPRLTAPPPPSARPPPCRATCPSRPLTRRRPRTR